MDLGIRGRIALVGASGRGLGLATAQRLAGEGCDLAICDKDEQVLDAALRAVKTAGEGIRVFAYPVDLTKADEIENLVASVKRDLGPVSILVTNSGGPPPGPFDVATDEKWLFAYHLTFLSAVRLIRAVLPDMKSQRWGRIINFTSRSLKEPIPNLIISNSVRLAVGGMAKTLAGEVAQYGITVNNVCPGPTSTDRAIELAAARATQKGITLEEEQAQTIKAIPIGRLARPEEQAAAAAFLASELAGYITGISLLVDGGAVKAL
ncbi:MAG: SDR family oxidoreductase [Ardenticatenaceae bacterium]|nr:SDR family oxidoreductase [Ardenticatenaceae bacterium]